MSISKEQAIEAIRKKNLSMWDKYPVTTSSVANIKEVPND